MTNQRNFLTVPAVLLMVLFAGAYVPAVRADELPPNAVQVGQTGDRSCNRNTVTFAVKGGKEAEVNANESKCFELQDVQVEIIWYSRQMDDGTKQKERCANDCPFNWVRCERAGNGRITWTFYRTR